MPVPKPGLGMLRACSAGFGLWLLMPTREMFYHQWKTFPTISAVAERDVFICALPAAGPALCCHTGDISLLVPSREGPLGTQSGQADVTDRHTDRQMLTLGGRCPELPGEDMPAALPGQGMWKGSLPLCWMAAAPFAPRRICLGAFWSRQQ